MVGVVLGAAALLASRDGAAGDGWALVRTEADGLALEARAVEGSDMPELRVTVRSPHAPQRLLDAAWALRADPYLAERKVLAARSDFRRVYLRYQPPVIAARWCVLEQLRSTDSKTGAASMSFTMQPTAPALDPSTPFARLEGRWHFVPGSAGTRVAYTVLIDVGGVPAFLARGAQQDAAVEAVREVVARAGAMLERR